VRIESELVALADAAINQILNEFLTLLAVHCLPPSFCRTDAHVSSEINYPTEPA
jgi:hypothetical protein